MARRISLAVIIVLAVSGLSLAQTVTQLKHPAPDGAYIEFQLTDGTVLVQGGNCTDWWKLTPDNTGSYVNGTWAQVASLPANYAPYAFASAVLADGRLIISGGEYSNCGGQFTLTNQSAIYDPVADTWTTVAPPKGWYDIGDSPSVVLPNGKYLVGRKTNMNMAELDPTTLTWKKVGSKGKADFNAEEGWTLMPDGTILTYDVKDAPNSEIYTPSQAMWQSAGSTIVDLHSPPAEGCLHYGNKGQYTYCPPGEVGPGILRPDGTVYATGSYQDNGNAPGHSAIYTPGANGGIGTWAAGPDFPNNDNAGDSFAVLLTNGNVLVLGSSGMLYEFNGKTLTPTVADCCALMDLPTGQVLVGGTSVYTSKGSYQKSWAPKITKFPSSVTRGSTYQISGKQFNGLSQAAAFGDEFQTATNYPLVRITNTATGHVFYARTHDHSTMGVATGSKTVSTNFDVPQSMETGASTLQVVANGIPSKAVSITVN